MAHRILATRIWGPAANALRRHPGPGIPPSPLAAAASSRFVGTIRNQNDIGIRRRPIDVKRIRDLVKKCKMQDEITRENLRRTSRFYKALEVSSYVVLSVYAAAFTACQVIVRRRKDKEAHVQQPT